MDNIKEVKGNTSIHPLIGTPPVTEMTLKSALSALSAWIIKSVPGHCSFLVLNVWQGTQRGPEQDSTA